MPFINPEDGYLTVVNMFKTDQAERVGQLVKEMSAIVDVAAYPGWISSTVHRGQDKWGTANFIQWRGKQDLESRYQDGEFKHNTIPVFREITTFIRLMQTEVDSSQQHPSLGGVTEIGPHRDDWTVIELIGVEPADQDDLVAVLRGSHEWLLDVPGYRSRTVLRGVRSRGVERSGGELQVWGQDNDFVLVYSQWDGKPSFDAFRELEEDEQSPARRQYEYKRNSLTTDLYWNSYRVAHTRSAPKTAAA